MEIGEHWAYRARPNELGGAVRQVEVIRFGGSGRAGRIHVQFLGGVDAGLQEWVSPGRLVAPWADVDTFRADDAAELALAEASREVRGSTVFEAARMILEFVRPKNRLRLRRTAADARVLELSHLDETAPLIGMDAAELRGHTMVYENRHGMCLAGWPVTERIARHVAGRLADEILPEVHRKQQDIQRERAQPAWSSYCRRDERKLDAEAAVLRTVREWCGVDKADRSEDDIPVPADTVTRILAGVAYGTTLPGGHPAAVSADGAWRLAPATGTWSKPEPAHIGALARQRARQRRIGELTDRISGTNASLASFDDRLRGLAARRARLDADRAARPDHRELDARRRNWDRAEEKASARDDTVRDAAAHLGRRETEVAGALRTLHRRAAEHGLPTDRDRLGALSTAVDGFRDTADIWVDVHLTATAAAERARQRDGQARRSRQTAEEQAEEAAAAEAEAAGLKARLEAVEATVGADYREVVARVTEARAELGRCREEAGRAADLLVRLEGRIGGLRATSGQDAERRERAVALRDGAAQRFRHLSLVGLAEDAGIAPELDSGDGTRATLEAARATAAKWPGIPHAPRNLSDAATRLSEAVHDARRRLGARADLDLEPDDDVQLFTATLDGVRVGATGLLTTLTQERDRSRDDITTTERRLFDQILTGDIRRHLAARIRQAGDLVDRMNGHLERVRTASNVAVQLVWDVRPDLPDGTRTARQLLLKDPGRVDQADREALHAFFRARIEEAKGGDTAASWEEQLGEVLDYTAWHRFTVRLDRANGTGWQPLTKKLHGALSGGEKAIALHLPLFAAVAAHYEAVPLAPRPILLDEVFVGVDAVNRGQVFALLTALDLDLMVTSDHEWCTYRELPGIAVHQLLTDGDDDAVTSARFVWNGTDLEAG